MEVSENHKETGFTHLNDEKTGLIQLKHEFINVGETIAQVKYSTSAKVTENGTIIVCQFKQQISSRANQVFYFSNDVAFFDGILDKAKMSFENIEFDKLNILNIISEQAKITPLVWKNINGYDNEKNEGTPISWEEWANKTETSLDSLKSSSEEDKFSECIENVILLVSGKYKKPKKSWLSNVLQKIFK